MKDKKTSNDRLYNIHLHIYTHKNNLFDFMKIDRALGVGICDYTNLRLKQISIHNRCVPLETCTFNIR